MATKIQNLHSLSAGNQPGDLLPGEIAYNLADGFEYLGTGGDNYVDSLGNVIGPATTPGMGWQQAIYNAAPVSGSVILAGLYDATQNLVTSVTPAGTAAGFTAASALPAAAAGNDGYYVLVTIGGTMAPPAPAGDAAPGDWIVSTGTAWSLVDQSQVVLPASNVAVNAISGLTATNAQDAFAELQADKFAVVGGTLTGPVVIADGGNAGVALTISNGGGFSVEGASSLASDLSIGGGLSVVGDSSLGVVTTSGNVTVGGLLNTSGGGTFGGAVTMSAITVSGAANVGGTGTFANVVSQTDTTLGDLNDTNSQLLNYSYSSVHYGTSTFQGDVVANGDVSLNGGFTTPSTSTSTINGKLYVTSFDNLYVNNVPATGFVVPIGGIIIQPLEAVPTGTSWARCDGSAISRTTYSSLFSLIGTTYGIGNGTTTFNLPDYRGMFLRGWGQNGTYKNRAGALAGDAARSSGSTQLDQFASHTHSYFRSNASGYGLTTQGGSAEQSATTGSAGNGTETFPVNIAVCYIIRIK